MEHIKIKPNGFKRIYLRHETGIAGDMIWGMRIDIYRHELVLNHTYFYDDEYEGLKSYPHELMAIDVATGKETIHKDNVLIADAQYGDRFHILHGYHNQKVFDKHIFVTRLGENNNICVYDGDLKEEFGMCEKSIEFVDSDASKNTVAFISKKEVILEPGGELEHIVEIDPFTQLPKIKKHDLKALGFLDELYIINQHEIDDKKFHKLCRTHELSEMLSVAVGSDYVYLLEEHLFDQDKHMDDLYSIYAIDPKTGMRIGRADLALFSGKTYTEAHDINDDKKAWQYFPGNQTGGYGVMLYQGGSIYAPHNYHQVSEYVSVGARTSCNGTMPCSQYLPGPAIETVVVREELCMEVLNIDSVGGHELAISYITCGSGDKDACGVVHNELGDKFYHIDIMHMSSKDEEFAYDSLDLMAFGEDYSHSCTDRFQWEIDIPYSREGKLVTYTEQYIVVPLVLKPIDFDKTPHLESVIVLYERESHAYHSFIKLGGDYHRDDTHEVVHPNQPPNCDPDVVAPPLTKIDIKMDVVIIDIDSDCDQIAVTYGMRFNQDYLDIKHKVAHELAKIVVDFPPKSNSYQIYTEVFRDEDHEFNCDAIELPVCERAGLRNWSTGIQNQTP